MRGRPHLQKGVQAPAQELSSSSTPSKQTVSPSGSRRRSPHSNSSGDSKPNASSRYQHTRRTSFTRSRSPAVSRNPTNQKVSNKMNSPNLTRYHKKTLLPGDCRFHLRFPLTTFTWTVSIDCRKLGESLLLLASVLFAASRISSYPTPKIPYIVSKNSNRLIARRNDCLNPSYLSLTISPSELQALSVMAFTYILWTHSSCSFIAKPVPNTIALSATPPTPGMLVRPTDVNRRHQVFPSLSSNRSDIGFIWMSVPKNYR